MRNTRQKTIITKIFTCALAIYSFLFLLSSPSYAAVSVYLSPSSGTYSSSFSLNLNINTGGDDVVGVDVNITYSGPVDFTSGSAGNAGCTPSISEASNVISVICLPPPTSPINGTATVARLNFSRTGVGTATMTISDEGGNLDTVSGGTYTMSASSSYGSTLPETAIGPGWKLGATIIGGSVLVAMGAYVYTIAQQSPNYQIFIANTYRVPAARIKRLRKKFERAILSLISR